FARETHACSAHSTSEFAVLNADLLTAAVCRPLLLELKLDAVTWPLPGAEAPPRGETRWTSQRKETTVSDASQMTRDSIRNAWEPNGYKVTACDTAWPRRDRRRPNRRGARMSTYDPDRQERSNDCHEKRDRQPRCRRGPRR